MNSIIIDNNYLSQQTIIQYCKRLDNDINILGVFDSVECAEEYIKTTLVKIDIIFLEAIFPGKSGVDFIADLYIVPVPYIIMTTSFQNYAVKAFDLNVVDYLMKPLIYQRFVQAIQKVTKLMKLDEEVEANEKLTIKNKGSITRFLIKDIDYIESYSDYVKIHIKKHSYLHLIALKEITKKLPENKFIQIHRRFVINIEKVISINENKISLEGNQTTELPISRAQRKAFYDKFLRN
ncbi:LytR/AlgR family response regulator transcription factor [Arcicella rigui]|uniref:LytTR family DNA-binding domain-containing protein n=1 Tax=Arcicella rigui TaxID=797020 RepID=A0ABU5QE96_9BACT|nr:LytTR family DNA-binding domain-containing protein [Arcicella rigui]MEA5141161.1 LytTR family DNA-binding domain-containing protein [Arcicella rigui]